MTYCVHLTLATLCSLFGSLGRLLEASSTAAAFSSLRLLSRLEEVSVLLGRKQWAEGFPRNNDTIRYQHGAWPQLKKLI